MYTKSKNIKQEFKKCTPVLSLINKYFWKTKIGPIFSFLFPLLLMVVYYAIAQSKGNNYYLYSSLPATLSLSILPLILLTLPTMNIEFRSSIILRKIKIIGISKITYIGIIYVLFILYSIIFTLFALFLFGCFSKFDPKLWSSINFGTLTYGWLALILSGIALGLMLSNFSKTSLSSQLIGFGVLLLTLIFSGQFMPLSVVGTIKPIKYISLFSPLSYSANIFNVGVFSPLSDLKNSIPDKLQSLVVGFSDPSKNIFDFSSGFWLFQLDYKSVTNKVADTLANDTGKLFIKQIQVYDIWQKVLFVFMPFVFAISFNWIFILKFKWANR